MTHIGHITSVGILTMGLACLLSLSINYWARRQFHRSNKFMINSGVAVFLSAPIVITLVAYYFDCRNDALFGYYGWLLGILTVFPPRRRRPVSADGGDMSASQDAGIYKASRMEGVLWVIFGTLCFVCCAVGETLEFLDYGCTRESLGEYIVVLVAAFLVSGYLTKLGEVRGSWVRISDGGVTIRDWNGRVRRIPLDYNVHVDRAMIWRVMRYFTISAPILPAYTVHAHIGNAHIYVNLHGGADLASQISHLKSLLREANAPG